MPECKEPVAFPPAILAGFVLCLSTWVSLFVLTSAYFSGFWTSVLLDLRWTPSPVFLLLWTSESFFNFMWVSKPWILYLVLAFSRIANIFSLMQCLQCLYWSGRSRFFLSFPLFSLQGNTFLSFPAESLPFWGSALSDAVCGKCVLKEL